jgi:hypothetical protein
MKRPRSLDNLLGVCLFAFALLCSSALVHDTLGSFDLLTPTTTQA